MSITATIKLNTDGTGQGNANGFTHSGFQGCNGSHQEGTNCNGTELEVEGKEDETVTVKIVNDSRQLGGFYKIESGTRGWNRMYGGGTTASFTLSDSLKIELAGSESATGTFATLTLTKVTPKPG